MYKYGHFNTDGTEFIVTNPKTPRAFDNFLWNDSLFSSVQQTGVGFFDYQIGDNEAVKLLTGIGRICDFDVFGRDGLMSRLIYIRDNDTGEFWNANWEPVKKEYDYYECVHGLGYTHIKSKVNGIDSGFRIFVPKGKDPVELWALSVENSGKTTRNLSIFVYNQFIFSYKWGFNSYGDMLFRNSFFNEKENAVVATKHPHISPHPYQTGFLTSDEKIVGFDGSRDFFVGTYNGLNEPEAVINGKCTNTEGSSDSTIGVAQYDIVLEAGSKKEINLILGISDSQKNIGTIKNKYLLHMDKYFNELKIWNESFININKITTPDEHLNRLTNIWIKHQTTFGAKWCRWGWMGYRDIVQHGYGVSSVEPKRSKEILEIAFKHQYSSGMALRGWNPVDEKPYSDSALWLVYTLISYLKETNDIVFLQQKINYYDKGEATVIEHIECALNFLEKNKGQHDLCLIKFGDWNDSLTAIGKDGKGESVWLSMAYAEALIQMKELFEYIGNNVKTTEYTQRYNNIKDAINKNAWDGEWFVRCFDDNGRAIGSNTNNQGKIFLNAQSWAMISGIADEERTDQLIDSSNKMLKSSVGYLLLAPTYTEVDENIGRISCLEPGICENGTVYSHVNVWMMLGLLKAGKVDEAYEAFKTMSPGYLQTGNENDPKQNMPPYIYANGYFGPLHRNNKFQMEFTWITGSVSWQYNTLTKELIGVKPHYNGLYIKPLLPKEWPSASMSRRFRNMQFEIEIERSNKVKEQSITLNGEIIQGDFISLEICKKANNIKVLIP